MPTYSHTLTHSFVFPHSFLSPSSSLSSISSISPSSSSPTLLPSSSLSSSTSVNSHTHTLSHPHTRIHAHTHTHAPTFSHLSFSKKKRTDPKRTCTAASFRRYFGLSTTYDEPALPCSRLAVDETASSTPPAEIFSGCFSALSSGIDSTTQIQQSLCYTLLHGVDDCLIAPLLAFNFAVWKFRQPAHAAHSANTRDWLINRVVESAAVCLSSIKPKVRNGS